MWSLMLRTSMAHEEGVERVFAVNTQDFVDDGSGNVAGLRAHEVERTIVDGRPSFTEVPDTAFELPCELVLLALGFTGPERSPMLEQLGVELDDRGNVARDRTFATNVPGVFVAGDMGRGQSLIVWAISEGRSAAAAADAYLMETSDLPSPVLPTDRPIA
jgi:glutamate synthase (NADPH/NADH) small chain